MNMNQFNAGVDNAMNRAIDSAMERIRRQEEKSTMMIHGHARDALEVGPDGVLETDIIGRPRMTVARWFLSEYLDGTDEENRRVERVVDALLSCPAGQAIMHEMIDQYAQIQVDRL